MAQQLINIGTGPNTKDGDTVRQAFNIVNHNFTEVYTVLGLTTSAESSNNFKGSLFADDSTLVVDGINGNVYTSNLVLAGATLTVDGGGNLTVNGTVIGGGTNPLTAISAYCPTGVSTVIYSASQYTSGMKMIVVMEGHVDGDVTGWHTQTCEVILAARGATNQGIPNATVYGIVYTSPTPLGTVTAQRNPTTNEIEIVVTPTGLDLYVKAQTLDITTSD